MNNALTTSQASIFPRLSIDSSRSVRKQSHVLNGLICFKCGARIVKHMPRIAGPWLASVFDSDRTAARAASEALSKVFPTPDKVHGVRKAFQKHVLEFCREAVLNETAATLSDERHVSRDDAEAVYARVVAQCLMLVKSLLSELGADGRAKELPLYDDIMRAPPCLHLINHSDPGVRRAISHLVQTCAEKQPQLLETNLRAVSKAFVDQGLHHDQTGSCADFVATLMVLTANSPSIWTGDYCGKKPAMQRFRKFVQQGSQSSAPAYWNWLSKLVHKLPEGVLPSTGNEAGEVLLAVRSGLARREERLNASVSWPAYFSIAGLLTSVLPSPEAESVLKRHALPVIRQYLFAESENNDFIVAAAVPSPIVAKIAGVEKVHDLMLQDWPAHAQELIDRASASQPEQSTEFDVSQKQIANVGERWCLLQEDFWAGKDELPQTLSTVFLQSNKRLLEGCVDLLKSRSGRPYGAAAIIEALLRISSRRLLLDEGFRIRYIEFAKKDLPTLLSTPSCHHLVRSLYSIRSDHKFSSLFEGLLRRTMETNEAFDAKTSILHAMCTSTVPREAADTAQSMPEFQTFVMRTFESTTNLNAAKVLVDLARAKMVSIETTNTAFSKLTSDLATEENSIHQLAAVDEILSHGPQLMQNYICESSGAGAQLLPNVLRLERSADENVAKKAMEVSTKLSSVISARTYSSDFRVILHHLETVSADSMRMDSLLDMADELIGLNSDIPRDVSVLPDLDKWQASLQEIATTPVPSLASVSPLGGAVHLAKHHGRPSVPCDAQGLSQALRISIYVAAALHDMDLRDNLGSQTARAFALLHIALCFAEDSLSVAETSALWSTPVGQARDLEMVLHFLEQAKAVLTDFWATLLPEANDDPDARFLEFLNFLDNLQEKQELASPMAYYLSVASAKARHEVLSQCDSSTVDDQKTAGLQAWRPNDRPIALAAYLYGNQSSIRSSEALTKFSNRIVADLTDVQTAERARSALELLVIFNIVLDVQQETVESIAKQRLIFLVKKLIPWAWSSESAVVQAEIVRALIRLLPQMQDMYGEHWEQVVSFLVGQLATEATLGYMAALQEDRVLLVSVSLELYTVLRGLGKSDGANEDLTDAMLDKKDQFEDAIIGMLIASHVVDDELHRPLMIAHERLAQHISTLTLKPTHDLSDLYLLVFAKSRAVAEAAFDLLHRHIPGQQEQVALDAALNDRKAHLPTELIECLCEQPGFETVSRTSSMRAVPLSLHSRLWAWRLIFDHFEGASHRVKNDYVRELKETSAVPELLRLTFDFLQHTQGKPVDASSFDVESYAARAGHRSEKDVQRFFTHLYYLALRHLPGLVKSYFLDVRSRQTSQAIESWTAKHISPVLTSAALREVEEWSETILKNDPDCKDMTVKVGMRSKEVKVGYRVDEEDMAIKVVIPESYPLAPAQVVGVHRVAVKEEKWQAWLRNCQGVITFSVSELEVQGFFFDPGGTTTD